MLRQANLARKGVACCPHRSTAPGVSAHQRDHVVSQQDAAGNLCRDGRAAADATLLPTIRLPAPAKLAPITNAHHMLCLPTLGLEGPNGTEVTTFLLSDCGRLGVGSA